ncbi:hypothetical protein BKA66DRAFT_450148 [Pyrenochaeta sp. MPI-SDFR-AT-0127]|nr:hypothetical protein BKA66DRAFT_450148 [Pyrenochaeta sp. MPI-SDFR-AT-0127]
MPAYRPVSFVSPISDTTRKSHDSSNTSTFRRLRNHLRDSVTLESAQEAKYRELLISDYAVQQEARHQASTGAAANKQHAGELRRRGADSFWAKHGESEDRKSEVSSAESRKLREYRLDNSWTLS